MNIVVEEVSSDVKNKLKGPLPDAFLWIDLDQNIPMDAVALAIGRKSDIEPRIAKHRDGREVSGPWKMLWHSFKKVLECCFEWWGQIIAAISTENHFSAKAILLAQAQLL